MKMWKLVKLEEGTPVQYLAVHAVKWRECCMGQPSVGFVELEYEQTPEEYGVLVRDLLDYIQSNNFDMGVNFYTLLNRARKLGIEWEQYKKE
jgi:hypothetical protein